MSETKFTPGPWSIWTSCSWRRIGNPRTGQLVCEPIVQRFDKHPDLHFHNGGPEGPDAHLISSAPDLYEALNNAVILMETHKEWYGDSGVGILIKNAHAALAKARGEAA